MDNIAIDPRLVEYRRPEVKLESFIPLSDQEVHDIIIQCLIHLTNWIQFQHG